MPCSTNALWQLHGVCRLNETPQDDKAHTKPVTQSAWANLQAAQKTMSQRTACMQSATKTHPDKRRRCIQHTPAVAGLSYHSHRHNTASASLHCQGDVCGLAPVRSVATSENTCVCCMYTSPFQWTVLALVLMCRGKMLHIQRRSYDFNCCLLVINSHTTATRHTEHGRNRTANKHRARQGGSDTQHLHQVAARCTRLMCCFDVCRHHTPHPRQAASRKVNRWW